MTAAPTSLSYPLVAFNYRVLIDRLEMRFTKVDGLSWERKAITYRDGLSFLDGESLGLSRVDSYRQLTLQQGVMEGDTRLHDWLSKGDSRTLQVQLCRADGEAAMAWHARKAVPIKLSGTSLDANTNEVFIDTLELMAAGWAINHPL